LDLELAVAADGSPADGCRQSVEPSGSLAWVRAGLISSISQYFDTTSGSSSAVTAFAGPSGIAALSKTKTK
jgi:hypothetical protein